MFHYGKVLPVDRGAGVFQEAMDVVVKKLNLGSWIHMFPGGSRNIDGSVGKIRNGVARLIAEPSITPIVVPIYHSGMNQILSRGEMIPVAFGKRLYISVGSPIDFGDVISKHRRGEISQEDLFREICSRIEIELNRLKEEVEKGI